MLQVVSSQSMKIAPGPSPVLFLEDKLQPLQKTGSSGSLDRNYPTVSPKLDILISVVHAYHAYIERLGRVLIAWEEQRLLIYTVVLAF